VRVVLVGDSTMATRTGYGDALCGLFKWQVECVNLARGGRSTKSYRADGSWEAAMARLRHTSRAQTYVLVQFGHNDQPGKAERATDLATEFPANLAGYVDEIRSTGATPLLVTPLARRSFDAGAVLKDDLAPWAQATRRVAAERGTPLLDLHADSVQIVARLGPARADRLAQAQPPDPKFDRTHVGPQGAALFARLVAREIAAAVPPLAAELVVGAIEPPGPIERPQLTDDEARALTHEAVLDGWDPLASGEAAPDLVVETGGSVQAAIDAAMKKGPARVTILIRPGTYEERVRIPATAPPITLMGEGEASAVRIRSRPAGGIAEAVVSVASRGFHARNLTIENAHNKDRGDTRDQTQAVALLLDDADLAYLDNVRLLGFQDTFFLAARSPTRPARAFVHRSYIEGDMDFIFGEATAYFLDTEVRSLGDRAVSYALAPSTHRLARHGFVFERCRFTHDGTPNALAGTFKLARQWARNDDAVGKVAILRSTIGAHIDRERPWADWSIGTPRHRPVQYEFLAEFENTWERP
jgi:pectin methylesterase-like acyl-CoA thioesterase/lysophospholipase L1-like esterase